MKKRFIFLLFLQLSALVALAQDNRTINQTIYSNLYETIISPTLVITSSSTLTLPSFASTTDLENGLESSVINIVVESNVDWKLTTEIGSITFTTNADSPAQITSPLTFVNFELATTDANNLTFGAYKTYGINFSDTKVGILGDGAVSGNTFNLKLRITPGYEVDPANYTVPFMMTITPQ